MFVGFYPYAVALAMTRCEKAQQKSFMNVVSNDNIWCRSLRIICFKVYFKVYLYLLSILYDFVSGFLIRETKYISTLIGNGKVSLEFCK